MSTTADVIQDEFAFDHNEVDFAIKHMDEKQLKRYIKSFLRLIERRGYRVLTSYDARYVCLDRIEPKEHG